MAMTDRERLLALLCKVECQGEENFANCPERRNGGCRSVNKLEICQIGAIADYLLANGVIVPHCKVGDVVYVVSQGQGLCMRWNVYEGKVVDIHLNRHNKLTIRVENGEKFFGYYDPCFIFLAKEEAEKALAVIGSIGGERDDEL